MTTSLREIVLSVRYGDAALVGESAGYLVLGVADLFAEMPRAASLDAVHLSDDGSVVVDASPCTFQESEASLRRMLNLLLQLVRTPCRNLDRVADRRETRGLAGLVAELESALVPVNRKAAKRSLARLVREAKKATARMGVLAAVEPVAEDCAPSFAEPIAPHANQPQFADHLDAHHGVSAQTTLCLPEVQLEQAPEDFEVVEVDEVFSELPTAVAPSVASATVQAPAPLAATDAKVIAADERASVDSSMRPSAPPVTGSQVTGTRGSAGKGGSAGARGSSSDLRTLDFLAREYGAQTPVLSDVEPAAPEQQEAPVSTEVTYSASAEVSSPSMTVVADLSAELAGEDDLADELPTQIFGGALEVEAVTTVPPTAMRAAPEKVLESLVRPSSTRSRPPIAEDVCLVPGNVEMPVRRPSDIQELLNRMPVSAEPDDEIYAGLKMLSRVELSPLAPPVGVDWMPNKIKAS